MQSIRTTTSLFCVVYKFVSPEDHLEGETLRVKEEAQKWVKTTLNDPIAKTLAKNSHLTNTQLETLLIDILAENISGKSLKYDEKARIRISSVSRGAFNRTLRQARRNVIQSIYTILLLGYLGVFEDTRLDPYLEVANKLRTYIQAHGDLLRKGVADEHLRIINTLKKELEMNLEQLSKPKTMSEHV